MSDCTDHQQPDNSDSRMFEFPGIQRFDNLSVQQLSDLLDQLFSNLATQQLSELDRQQFEHSVMQQPALLHTQRFSGLNPQRNMISQIARELDTQILNLANNSTTQQPDNLTTQSPEQLASQMLSDLDALIDRIDLSNETTREQVAAANRLIAAITGIQLFNNSDTQQSSNSDTRQLSEPMTQLPGLLNEHQRRDLQAQRRMAGNLTTQQSSNSDTRQLREPNTYYVQPTPRSTVEPTQAILAWCAANGWSDPYWVPEHEHPVRGWWWGFQGKAIMAVELPTEAQTGKFDPSQTPLGTNGDGALRVGDLCRELHAFLMEYKRRNHFESRLSLRSLTAYFDYTLQLLRPDESVCVVNTSLRRSHFDYTLHLGFARLQRVERRLSMVSPLNDSIYMAELVLQPDRLERTLDSDVVLIPFLLSKSLDVLQHLGMTPHPRWFVGTTEQSNRGADSDIPTTTINQRDTYVSSPYQCGWRE